MLGNLHPLDSSVSKQNDYNSAGIFVARLKSRSMQIWQLAAIFVVFSTLLSATGIGLIGKPDIASVGLAPTDTYVQVPHDLGIGFKAAFGDQQWASGGFSDGDRPAERWQLLVIVLSLALPMLIGLWSWDKSTGSALQKAIKVSILFAIQFLVLLHFLSAALWRYSADIVVNRQMDYAVYRELLEDSRYPNQGPTGQLSMETSDENGGYDNKVWCEYPTKVAFAGRRMDANLPNPHGCIIRIDLQNLAPLVADQARYVFAQNAFMEGNDALALQYMLEMSGAWQVTDDVTWTRLLTIKNSLILSHPGADLRVVRDMLSQRVGYQTTSNLGLLCFAGAGLLLLAAIVLGWTGRRRYLASSQFADVLDQIQLPDRRSAIGHKT